MATENYQNSDILNFKSAAAVTANLGVKLVAGQLVEVCDTAGERSYGAALDTVTAENDDVGVLPGPAFKLVTTGAAYADLAPLAMDADGKYVAATAGQVAVAIAMEQATAANQQKRALILPPAQYRIASAHITVPAAISGGESPTEAEFNALRAVVASMAAALEAHGILAAA